MSGGFTYPAILAGQRMSAGVYDSMLPLIAYKTAVTNSTTATFANDPDLSINLPANTTWEVEMWVQYAGLLAANIAVQWAVPSGASCLRQILGPSSNANNSLADQITMRAGVHGPATTVVYSCARNGTNQQGFVERGIVTMGSTAGPVALTWAQAVANATATEVCAGSIMTATRLA